MPLAREVTDAYDQGAGDGQGAEAAIRDGTTTMPVSPMKPPLAPLLAVAVEAAREAGRMLRAEFHRPGGIRGAGSLAEVDAEVEGVLKARLRDALPCNWLGEETDPVDGADDRVWVVDPNDGTASFLKGLRGSSVSIALLDGGRPVLGVVHAFGYPNDVGDLMSWAEGCGPVHRNGVAIEASLAERTLSAGEVVAVSQDAPQVVEPNARLVAPARFLAVPSVAYRLALAACGEVVAGCSLIGLHAWDVAGGHALILGAGGTLLDGAGKPVTYAATGDTRLDGCFGGAPAAVATLATRDWRSILQARAPGPYRPALLRGRIADASRLGRAQGCLLGQIAGDALGALVEFEGRASIAASHPGGLRSLADGGPWDIIAGQPTDDGEMALALARSIAAVGGYDAEVAFGAYVGWLASSPFDVGGTTRTALGIPFARAGSRTGDSQANGSLMRVSPIGIAHAGDPGAAARHAGRDSALTHPHPVCVAACRAHAAAIAEGIASGDREAMVAAALRFAGDGEGGAVVRQVIEAARTSPPADHQTQMGWVRIALQEAFHRLNLGGPAAEAVTATVMQGGDTDTNGAITGALLGAADGLAAFPDAWRLAVTTCRPMRVTGATRPRPPACWPDDVLDLAEALLPSIGRDTGSDVRTT